jgi:hypothetical protein
MTMRPVIEDTRRRRGCAKRVPAKTLRSGAVHTAMAGQCRACMLGSTSAAMPSAAARLLSSRTPAADPASTCVRGPS